jgi:DNA-binding beta-propeller fold protein YncE
MPAEGARVPAPRAVHATAQGDVYVLDNAGRVVAFDAKGHVTRQWWMPDHSVGKPEKICLLKDGRLVVADTHYHRLVFFDCDGRELARLGGHGHGPGEFVYPVAITQDGGENLYVCEYGDNHRVQKFTSNGTFVLQFGAFGTAAGEFQRPSGITWCEGRLYVADAFNNRIQVFSEEGEFLEVLGSSNDAVSLHYPYDIAAAERGDLYVVEYGAGRVSKLDRSGRLLGRFGTTGTDDGCFSTPWGLSVCGKSVYVADTGNRRVVELKL